MGDIVINPGHFTNIVEKCSGCDHVVTHATLLEVPATCTCRIYLFPESRWSAGNCPMATNIKKEEKKEEKHIDPIKASKNKMKGR